MAAAYFASRNHSERERWISIYPAYINSKKTIAEGRRLPRDKCVENPTYQEIRDVLDSKGFQVGVENKLYPREQNKDSVTFRGRIRVQLKNDDSTPVNANYPTRKALMMCVCEMIPKLKSRTQRQGGGDSTQGQAAQASKKGGGGKGNKKGKR
ncbi:signal recognition particle 19 kDa protein-like [Ornithodoros turicata]|uniref:signal recognition particle 19 kDa protein-like n=1 Tax=Ornithodoros turicata TaxID=34597 RepID=UPI0031389695